MPFLDHAPSPPGGSPIKGGDFGGMSILVGNGVTILLALVQGWDLGPLLLIYWAQSVIIGMFHLVRILILRQFSAEGCTYNNKPIPETWLGKLGIAVFFAIHYGFFHLVYLFFITAPPLFGDGTEGGTASWGDKAMLVGIFGFVVSHAVSFFRNVRDDLSRRPNIGKLMFLPYLRIVPMHITLMVGHALDLGGGSWVLVIFLLLKTAADYGFHIIEHRIFQKEKKGTGDGGG